MDRDIEPLLREWPHDSENPARKIVGADGREKVQMRVRLGSYNGIVQFDCDGRPDGVRPHGREFALDHFEESLRRQESAGRAREPFALTPEQVQELFAESTMVYERYIVLLQLGDWDRVLRDTERNMRLFRFVNRRAEREEDRDYLEKWWPYIIRLRATALAEKRRAAGEHAGALAVVREARREIAELAERDEEIFRVERQRSLKALAEIEERVERERPLNELERLEREKEEAVRRQDYERAAVIRDRIKGLRGGETPE